jgi:hypothetical protein
MDSKKGLDTQHFQSFSIFIQCWLYTALPTPGKCFRPNPPKNSAVSEKIRPHTVSLHKGSFLKTSGQKVTQKLNL